MKRKRTPRRYWLVIAAMLLVLVALLLHAETWQRVPDAPCQSVDPQDVGNRVERGAMVAGCLEGIRR